MTDHTTPLEGGAGNNIAETIAAEMKKPELHTSENDGSLQYLLLPPGWQHKVLDEEHVLAAAWVAAQGARRRARTGCAGSVMRLLGLMGLAGAGKDTVADTLVTLAPMDRRAFADALRAEIASAFGIDARILYDRVLREQPLHSLGIHRCSEPAFAAYAYDLVGEPRISPRRMLRRWGDWRRSQRLDYWIERAEAARVAAVFDGHQAQLWTDVRYPNEAAWIRQRGGMLWRIVRPGLAQDRTHDSETAADDIEADAVIVNDSTIDQLRMRVVDLADALDEAE